MSFLLEYYMLYVECMWNINSPNGWIVIWNTCIYCKKDEDKLEINEGFREELEKLTEEETLYPCVFAGNFSICIWNFVFDFVSTLAR
jgi:hypothetical protein